MVCTYCGYYEKPQAKLVGKGAEEFEFKVETLERLAQGWGEERQELSCQSCGASVTLPAGRLTVTCPFCGSNKVIHQQASQTVLRPKFVLPFKIEAQASRKIATEWLGSSWMTPAALQQSARMHDFTPLYLPFWTFDSRCRARWKAEVGYTTTERYYDGKQWRTRTVTRWRWESGNVDLTFDDLPIVGTERLSQKHLNAIKQYDLSELREYDPSFLAGILAKIYDVPLETAWERGREQMREATKQGCLAQTSTRLVRNFSMQMDFSDESWRYVLLPVYLTAYQYENKPFQVLINGQTGAISGQRPVDWQKVWLVIALCLLPGAGLGLAGLVTLIFGGLGVVIGGIGFFLLVLGLVGAFFIYQKADSMDDL